MSSLHKVMHVMITKNGDYLYHMIENRGMFWLLPILAVIVCSPNHTVDEKLWGEKIKGN